MLYRIFCLTLATCALFSVQSGFAQSALPDSVARLKDTVEAHPEDSAAHRAYISAVGIRNPALEKQYQTWIRKYPKSTLIPFMLAEAYWNAEDPRAAAYLQRLVAGDPHLDLAWFMLAIDAERWGNAEQSRYYMGQAAVAAPNDPSYAFYYAMDFELTDPTEWRRRIYDLEKRFPDSERGAQGLYWLANRSRDMKEKLKVYEQLKADYPPGRFSWSASGMEELFELYVKTDPRKALQLAREMKEKPGWDARETLVLQVTKADSLLQDQKYTDALQATLAIRLPPYTILREYLAFLQARIILAFGDQQAAYDTLASACAREPTDSLYAGLHSYGAALGKNDAAIESDLWKLRAAAATPASPFSLGLYTENRMVSLADFKGRVILLTFWFPGCGPCRGEFPHFQRVLDKFRDQPVAYLGVNVLPSQDDYVVPFMSASKYTFTPLRGSADFALKAYGVRGEPTNFLIDQNGHIIFSRFRTDANNERTLELMIRSMLNRKD